MLQLKGRDPFLTKELSQGGKTNLQQYVISSEPLLSASSAFSLSHKASSKHGIVSDLAVNRLTLGV